MERSFFLKSMAALSAAGLGLHGLSTGMENPASENLLRFRNASSDDWTTLKKHFSLPEGYRYFNTAGIGAVPVAVREQLMTYWAKTEIHPQPGYDHGYWTTIKQAVSNCVGGGGRANNIALTNSTTEGINIILNGFPWKKGDEIICSTHEHPALHVPLINISHRKDVRLRIFEPDLKDGRNNVSKILNLTSSNTKLIFLSIVTCTTGQLLPIEEIIHEAHKRGILVALDGAQCTGSRALKLADWDVDFYASGGQKWLLGPKRTGLLYIKEEHLDLITPTTVGAYSENGYDILQNQIDWAADATRYEFGTQNDSLFHGLFKSVNFLSTLGFDAIQEHNENLAERLYDGLKEISGVYIISPEEREYRTSIISFGLESVDYKKLSSELSKKGFRVRVVTEAGLSAVRVSFHVYNSEEEINALLVEIKALAG